MEKPDVKTAMGEKNNEPSSNFISNSIEKYRSLSKLPLVDTSSKDGDNPTSGNIETKHTIMLGYISGRGLHTPDDMTTLGDISPRELHGRIDSFIGDDVETVKLTRKSKNSEGDHCATFGYGLIIISDYERKHNLSTRTSQHEPTRKKL